MLQQVFRGSTIKCPCKTTPLTEEQLKGRLRMADNNGDGCLSKEELKEAFRELGSHLPAWRARQAVRYADKNGDGHISQEELDQLVTYARKQNYKNPGCSGYKI